MTQESHAPSPATGWVKLLDFAAALPLIIWLAWNCGLLSLALFAEAQQMVHAPQLTLGLRIVNQTLAMTFFAAQIVLFALRPVAKHKSRGVIPRFIAIVTTGASLLYFYVPLAPSNDFVQALATLFGTAGLALAVYTLRSLGRSFSVLPEARILVTDGPYRIVRHPLYVAEALSTLGVTLQLQQPLGALIAFAIFLGQYARMGFEEEVLERSFPDYEDYKKRTFRLIPYVY